MSLSCIRVTRYDFPESPAACPFVDQCIYNEHGKCDDPYWTKQNSDAYCHKMTNRKIVEILRKDSQK